MNFKTAVVAGFHFHTGTAVVAELAASGGFAANRAGAGCFGLIIFGFYFIRHGA